MRFKSVFGGAWLAFFTLLLLRHTPTARASDKSFGRLCMALSLCVLVAKIKRSKHGYLLSYPAIAALRLHRHLQVDLVPCSSARLSEAFSIIVLSWDTHASISCRSKVDREERRQPVNARDSMPMSTVSRRSRCRWRHVGGIGGSGDGGDGVGGSKGLATAEKVAQQAGFEVV